MTALATNGRGQAVTTERPAEQADLLERVVEATRYSVRDVEVMAKKAAASRLFGMDENQAFTLMMIAESEGIHPMQAMKRYHIIEGRPSMRADAMQAEFQRHGGRLKWTKTDELECVALFWHPTFHPDAIEIRVTMHDLVESEVAMTYQKRWDGNRNIIDYNAPKVFKDTYKKYPRQMLRARVISEGVRAIDPGIIVGIYTPEEASDFEPTKAEQQIAPPPVERPIPPPATERRKSIPAPVSTHSEPIVNRSPMREWVETECQRTKDLWNSHCAMENKESGRTPNVSQVTNHLIRRWLELSVLDEADITTDGKRDKFKLAQVMTEAWGEDEAEIKADVRKYLWTEVCQLAEANGMEPPSESDWTQE